MASPAPASRTDAVPASASRLEKAVVAHLGIFLLLLSWGFGGNSPWSRQAACVWGTVGAALTFFALRDADARWRAGRWLWPTALLNLIVGASLFNPTLLQLSLAGEVFYAKTGGHAGWPGSAQPEATRSALWLFDGILLSCFNLLLVVRQRRSLRGLLLLAGGNALALAVFGTLQKFSGAKGLYFGLVQSPQQYFFASFIYHNHWGAFTVLMVAISLGLVGYYARRTHRDFWHSPAPSGLVAVFFLAVSIALSTSRSCTLLVLVLLGGGFVHWLIRVGRRRTGQGGSAVPPLLGVVVVLVSGAIAYKLAQPVIEQRVAKTLEQVAQMRSQGGIGSRATLYRDTWHMASDRLLFGWGMASYPRVFLLYNNQRPGVDRLPLFYYDAHSDWLQSVAELGLVGTMLIGLQGLVPLASLRRWPGMLSGYLFAGCGLILLYAWVEFPFGNPAVVFAWWLCFFAAIRYARLDHRAAEP
ncbi:MAG TPA: O-antigen ligase family protein [Opitutaceae bacterium]|nr:O-antigen ligase family protein [Opitutaceae bacterium]